MYVLVHRLGLSPTSARFLGPMLKSILGSKDTLYIGQFTHIFCNYPLHVICNQFCLIYVMEAAHFTA